MRPSTAWSYATARLLGLLAAAVAGGLLFGHIAIWVTAVLGVALLVDLTHLWRLERWLRKRRTESPPDFTGVWGDIVALIMRIYRRKQFHKRRIVELFREFRRMTTAMPDGVIVLNEHREILWFNRTAARLLGLRRKIDFGLRIENLIRHPDFVRYLDARDYASPIILGAPLAPDAFLSLHVVAYGAGQQLLLVRDVTRAVRIEAMRKDFVANASHELRSPLTVISGYLDALADDASLDSAWSGPLAEMRRQAERMRAVVNDLIELSRLEASDAEAGADLVDVCGMVSLMRKEVLTLSRRPHEVRLHLRSDAKLLGVEPELHSIFWNLISNAVKYTPTEGSIDISWWVDAQGAHFAVQDTGIGIAAEHLPRITERFYRVDPGRSRATGGSGLGLAIVKHALSRHGANLAIQSEEGRGSTFTCHFPSRRVVLAVAPAPSEGRLSA
jgi:two-component system, OmpR family, phosphate regulon sensor histidine kinase PhoR